MRTKLAPLSSQIIPQSGILFTRDYQVTPIMVASEHTQDGSASYVAELERGSLGAFPSYLSTSQRNRE